MTIVLSPHSVRSEDAPKQLSTLRFLSDLAYDVGRNDLPIAICRVLMTADRSYEYLVRSFWPCLEDILLIEHDIVPTLDQFYSIINCKHQFCAGVYYMYYDYYTDNQPHYSASRWINGVAQQVEENEEWAQYPSLGFVKFGAPRPKIDFENAWKNGMDKIWNNFDSLIQMTFLQAQYNQTYPGLVPDYFRPWHLHWPIVTHNNPSLQKFPKLRMPPL